MKRTKIVSLLLVLILCFMTACGQGAGKNGGSVDGKGIKAILTISDGSDTFRASLAAAAKEAADSCGMSLEILDAAGSSEAQMNHIKNAKDADVIICALCDSSMAQQMEALAGDKPIVFINSCPSEEYLEPNHYVYVGSDEGVAGGLQAEYVLNYYQSQDSLNIAIIKGESTHSATIGRTKANKAVLNASGKQIHYVFEDNADWGTDTAAEMFDLFLATGQSVDAVLCNNDSMALGIVEAAKANGLNFENLLVLGVDATEGGLASVAQGEMACTVYQPAVGQGKAAVLAAAQMVHGDSIASLEGAESNEMYMWVPFELVTKENVGSY